jgi:predicted RNase H-like nuclease (RuvC/YqgF family)
MRKLFEFSLVLLLAGCQSTPLPPPAPPPAPVCPAPPPAPEAAELRAVLATAEDLRKALMLSQGRNGAELAQATAQLDAIAATAEPRTDPVTALAVLLSARLADQRRQQDTIDKLTVQLREAQRRNEQLNEKLEALKAIEQSLPGKPGRAP